MSTLEDDLGAAPTGRTDYSTSSLEDDLGPSTAPSVSSHPVTDEAFQSAKNFIKQIPRHIIQAGGALMSTFGNNSTPEFNLSGSEGQVPGAAYEGARRTATALENKVPSLKPVNEGPLERIAGQGLEGGLTGIIAGPEAMLPSMVSGEVSQGAREMGAGPLVQTAADFGVPVGASAIAAGTKILVRGGAAGAARMAQRADIAENAGLKASVGQLSGNPVVRGAETTGAHLPGGGALAETRGAGLNQQVEKKVSDIVKDLAPDLNQKPPTPTAAGESVQEGLKKRIGGLKQETNEVTNAMYDAMGGRGKPTQAPNLEAASRAVTSSTGDPDIDRLVTGAKTKSVANTVEKVSTQPKVPTSYSTDGEGAHVVKSPNGETHAIEQANGDLKVWRSDTAAEAQGKGEGTSRLSTLAHVATSKGGKLVSDISVSPGEVAAYERLGRQGWQVNRNPNAEVLSTGNLVSDSPKNPVYTVTAPKTTVSSEQGTIKQPTESKFSGEWTYDPSTGKTEPVTESAPAQYTPKTQAELNAPTPWTVEGLKETRTNIGKAIDRTRDPVVKRQLQTMYGAASDDLRTHAQSVGAESSWDMFNSVAKQNADTQKTLIKAMKEAGGPEQAFTAAMSGTKAGASKVAPIMSNLDNEGKNLFRATVLHRLGRAGGAVDRPFDANLFLNNWKNMSPEAKNVLFGEGANAGPPTQLRKNLDALNNALDMFAKQGDIKSGFVKGVQEGTSGLHKLGIFGVLAVLGEGGYQTVSHVAQGHPYLAAGAGAGAAGVLAGNPIMSRVLTNPKVVAWLTQATRAPRSMVPSLLNHLHQMGGKDSDAKDLESLIQGQSQNGQGASTPPPTQTTENDTGVSEEGPITNNHKMVRMKGQEGAAYYGVDPNTLTNNPYENPASRPPDKVSPDDYLPAKEPPISSTSQPSVFSRAAGGLLNALIPSAQAADTAKIIGGKSWTKIDDKGNITQGGVKISTDELKAFIAKEQTAIKNNQDTIKSLPFLANSPAMKKIMDDMNERIKEAQEILAKATKGK